MTQRLAHPANEDTLIQGSLGSQAGNKASNSKVFLATCSLQIVQIQWSWRVRKGCQEQKRRWLEMRNAGLVPLNVLQEVTLYTFIVKMYSQSICWHAFVFSSFRFLFLFVFLVYFWQRWVYVAAAGISLAEAGKASLELSCAGFSRQWLLLLQSAGSRALGLQ